MLCTEKGDQVNLAMTSLPWTVRTAGLGAHLLQPQAPHVVAAVGGGATVMVTTKRREQAPSPPCVHSH